ncbi:MAG TPA: glycerol kinase GlpK [Candidatus Binataceae bacterium]|nr:glycerol kinase GlpK [Candidatus Binataceae bacterium]
MAKAILAIDQGTTRTTVMVIDASGRILSRAYGEVRQFYPRPGWVEHDAEQIYRSVIRLAREAIAAAGVADSELAGVGITNQRETFVVWDRANARPVHRAIVWQCRRSAGICERLREREDEIQSRTGVLADPYFSGTKLKWLLDSDRNLRRRAVKGELCFGTIETWLIFKLSRGKVFASDYTNASRTMMLNLERLEWDPIMLEMLGVPAAMLPALVSSHGTIAEAVRGTICNRALPIVAAIGDQQSALFGQGCTKAGDAKVTYGTGAFLLTHTGDRRMASRNRLVATSAVDAGGAPSYALEGSVFIAGAAVQWIRDELGLIGTSAESVTLARKSRDRTHPFVVPAFAGLGAPYWDSEARGAIFGLSRGTTRADLVRATLDSIAYQVADVLAAMEKDTGGSIPELRVDGGAAANDYLMQFQADLLGRPVRRPAMLETTALGAALLAGFATGLWRSPEQIRGRIGGKAKIFRPTMRQAERDCLLALWHDAVARTLTGRNSAKSTS